MKRFIISGGGTGGHIFPAISIANAIRQKLPDAEILFVGAEGRMEMERVPAAGYRIVGLPVSGFDRKNMLRNIKVMWNLLRSLRKARGIVRSFRPDVAVGVGGYASAPVLKAAAAAGIPCLIQEQNSYAGVTNKLLARKASLICIAYEGMERFFPKEKIRLTGNPVRQDLLAVAPHAQEAYDFFGFDPAKKTLLIIGGSLGARSINQSVAASLESLSKSNLQIIWQTGKSYIEEARKAATPFASERLLVCDFISRMDYAYAVSDLVVSRAGASSVSEISLLGKALILIPSPNVAEDHQTKNALALVEKDAAVMISDTQAKEQMITQALALLADDEGLRRLSENIKKLAQQHSAERIAEEVIRLASDKK